MLWQRLFGFFSFFGLLKGLGQILELLGFTGFLSGPIGIDVTFGVFFVIFDGFIIVLSKGLWFL